jgi:hypothetical protein
MRLIQVVLILCVCAASVFAQAGAGTMTGILSDPTGAIVANAAIEAKNVETGAVYRATSTDTGNYTIPQLPPGRYELSINVSGFKKYNRENLSLAAAQVMRLDVGLEVGSNAETVTVTAEASLLKTENSELASNVTTSQMQNLPILSVGGNGTTATSGVRNPWSLVQLIPGTQFNSNSSMSVNGSSTSYSIRIEGMDATMNDANVIYTQRIQPSVDAIQEVSVQTSNYAAEFGTVGGGIFNTTMKSGTNQYHGNLYDYAVNEITNAAQPYTNSKTTQRRHDYGGTLGGPIKIPKLYNGSNKTFFFWNFEQFRENALISQAPTGGFPTVPIQDYRNGNFAQVILGSGLNGVATPLMANATKVYVDPLGRSYNSGAIFDATTWTPVTCNLTTVPTANCTNGTSYQVANQFVNNVIPTSYFDPVAVKILALVPQPKGVASGQLVNNFQNPWVTHRTTEIPSLKLDQTLGAKGHISLYYGNTGTESQYSSPNGNMEGFPEPITAARGTFIHSRTIRLNYDYTLTPSMLLHLGAGYFNENFDDHSPTTNYNAVTSLGLTGATLNRNFPNFTTCGAACPAAGGMSTLGTSGGIQSQNYEQKPQGNATLSWVKRSHSIKAGAEWRATGYPNHNLASTAGSYTFGTGPTSQPALQGVTLSQGSTGFAFADFLEGYVTAGSVSVPTAYKTGQQQWAIFLQDTWKVTRKLTLDVGIRWDYGTYSREEHGRFGNFSPTLADPSAGGHPGATIYEATCNCNFASNYPFALGPRIGVAYQIDKKTVIRAGLGVVYTPISAVGGSATSSANAGTPGFDQYLFNLKNGLPTSVHPVWPAFDPANAVVPGNVAGAATFLDPNSGRPSRQVQWSISLQREVSRNLVVEASYVANRNVWTPVSAGGSLGSLNAISEPYLRSLGFNDFTSASDASLLTSTIANLTPSQKSVLASRGINLTPYAGFPTSQTVRQALYPYPQYSVVGGIGITPSGAPVGKNWYDAMQLTVTKRLSHGLSLNANYTYSKALSLQTSPDIFNTALGKNLNSTDLPNQFRLSAEYTTPRVHSGNKILGNRLVSYALSDWGMGWFLQYQSAAIIARPAETTTTPISQFTGRGPGSAQYIAGQPLYSTDWTDYSGVHHTDELDINCHCFDPTKTIVLNPKAWANIPNGVWGAQQDSIRNFRGFRYPQENVNFSRNFRLKERLSLQIRAEFTNAFNRTQLPQPNAGAGNNFNSLPTTFSTGSNTGLYSGGFGSVVPVTGTANARSGLLIARLTF